MLRSNARNALVHNDIVQYSNDQAMELTEYYHLSLVRLNKRFIALPFAIAMIAIPPCVSGQISNDDLRNSRIIADLDRVSRPSQLRNAFVRLEGNPYYSKTWNRGRIQLYDNAQNYSIEALRYDGLNCCLEFAMNGSIKALDCQRVRSFEYVDSLRPCTDS